MKALAFRRWFRFSLRTLFMLTTLLAVWLGVQLKWSKDRRQAREWLSVSETSWYAPSLVGAARQACAPWSLRLIGEQGVVGIGLDAQEFSGPSPYTLAQLKRLFPEAQVAASRDGRFVADAGSAAP